MSGMKVATRSCRTVLGRLRQLTQATVTSVSQIATVSTKL
jgi:hypothetical protein